MSYVLETLNSPTDTQGGENAAAESISRKDTSAAYLAAAIDGEGCIYSYFKKQTNPQSCHCLTLNTAVSIWNTNPFFIRRVTECLLSIEVPFVVTLSRNGDKRKGIQVVIQGKGRTDKLLQAILPYLGGKRRQAEIVLEIIAYRESLAKRFRECRGKFDFMRLDQDARMIELIESLKREKHEYPSVEGFSRQANRPFGESSETLRLPPFPMVMIKSELNSDIQLTN